MLLVLFGAVQWWQADRVFARMQPTTCRLVTKAVEGEIVVHSTRRGNRQDSRARYQEQVRLVFAYTHNGHRYLFTEERSVPRDHARYQEGGAYPCRYDPHDLGHGTVATYFDWAEYAVTVGLGIAVMAFGVVIPLAPRSWKERLTETRRR